MFSSGKKSTVRSRTLPPVENTPVLLIRFTDKADEELISLVAARLKEEGLIIIDGNSDDVRLFGITCSQETLALEAQKIRLLKMRSDTQIMEAFDIQCKERYCDNSKPWRDSAGLFSPNEWSLLVNCVLEDCKTLREGQISSNLTRKFDKLKVSYRRKLSTKIPILDEIIPPEDMPSQPLRHVLEASGYIDACSPIHRRGLKDEIWNETCGLSIMPPVEKIRLYYGDEVAFYFAWMGSLTQWLFFPGIVGLCTSSYRWYRGDNVMNDEYTPFYGIITFFWSVLFIKFWHRREVRLSYQWGVFMGEYEKRMYFAVRPEFYGRLRKSKVTGQPEAYYPDYKRRIKYVVSALVTIAMLNAAFWTMILSLNMQGYINPKYDPDRWLEGQTHPFHWPALSKLAEPGEIFDMQSSWKCFIPVILHVATIFTFNNLYRIVAVNLTQWENHRTRLAHSNSLILKRFLFEAFDCYVALFYLAFYERNIDKLRFELVNIFNIDTLRRVLLECIVPMLTRRLSRAFREDKKVKKKNDNGSIAVYTPLADQAELDEYEQFDDFMEIVIQFGYVALFASAYPLASLISILANLVEIRSDAFKLTYLCRRPRSFRCDGLNVWNKLVRGIVWLSALTNCLIFGFTSGQLMEWLPHLYHIDDSDHMRFQQDKGWIVIFIIFGLERALLYIGMLLDAMIPSLPEDVMDEVERKHFVQEQEAREFEHQQKKASAGVPANSRASRSNRVRASHGIIAHAGPTFHSAGIPTNSGLRRSARVRSSFSVAADAESPIHSEDS